MKEIRIFRLAAWLSCGVVFGLQAEIRLVSPREGEVLSQLKPVQAKLVRESLAQREKYFDGDVHARALKADKSTPKPITLAWEGGTGPYTVEVKRLGDGKVFFTKTLTENKIDIDSLEIARTWRWQVSGGGETASGTFKTEDVAPRLIAIDGTVNARDIGGWKGLGGRRIKQGLLFRTAGLNNNAPIEYYSLAEITRMHQEGRLAKMGAVGKNHARQLDAGEKLQEKDMRLVKRSCFAPGKARLTRQECDRLAKTYGFKTDIDLRRPDEVYGMTGSPLGPHVEWLNVPLVSGYGGFAREKYFDEKRAIFRKIFDLQTYPIVFHCIAGADRTGTIAFMIEALLGADDNTLALDYLVSGFVAGVTDAKHKQWFDGMVKTLKALPGETNAEKMNGLFLKMGFTQKEIDAFRAFMLE